MEMLSDAERTELRDKFYQLASAEDVAKLLGVRYSHLTFLLYGKHADHRYSEFQIPKRGGGARRIQAPCVPLKILQRRLNRVLHCVYRPKATVHGFVPERSVVTNATLHTKQRYVLNLDLKDFFPSIHFGRVRGLFMAEPYLRNDKVATVLAQICCFGDGRNSALPQGAPTSPIVSNMICGRMDTQLRRLAQDHRCVYTRYADDITFSTNQRDFPKQLAAVRRGETRLGKPLRIVIKENWFAVHPGKVRLRDQHGRQEVTGITTNSGLNVQRRFVRQIKSMLHAWERYGEARADAEFAAKYDEKHREHGGSAPFREVVLGKLGYLGMVKGRSDQVYVNLVRWGREIDIAHFRRLPIPDDAVWVLTDASYATQGTAFAVRDFGWVTCAHVIVPDCDVHHTAPGFSRNRVTVRRISNTHDVCVFDVGVRSPHPLRLGNPDGLRVGDEVTILGFPAWGDGKPLQVTKAKVVGFSDVLHIRRINVDGGIIGGNSGGPVLNDRGEVIGIAAKGSDGGSQQSEIIPITAALALTRLPPGREEEFDAFA